MSCRFEHQTEKSGHWPLLSHSLKQIFLQTAFNVAKPYASWGNLSPGPARRPPAFRFLERHPHSHDFYWPRARATSLSLSARRASMPGGPEKSSFISALQRRI